MDDLGISTYRQNNVRTHGLPKITKATKEVNMKENEW